MQALLTVHEHATYCFALCYMMHHAEEEQVQMHKHLHPTYAAVQFLSQQQSSLRLLTLPGASARLVSLSSHVTVTAPVIGNVYCVVKQVANIIALLLA